MKLCKFQADGYCIRPENDYCYFNECKGDHSITEICKHPNTAIVVVKAVLNCETTVTECLDCNEILTEPRTDCR